MTPTKLVVDVVELYKSVQDDPRMQGRFIDLATLTKEIVQGVENPTCNVAFQYESKGDFLLSFVAIRDINHAHKNAHLSRIVALTPDLLLGLSYVFEKTYPGFTLTAYRRGQMVLYSVAKIRRILRFVQHKLSN